MTELLIQLHYIKIIEHNNSGEWEKLVFEESYQAFLNRSLYYDNDNKYKTFSELVSNVPDAVGLNSLVGDSIDTHVQGLDTIPDIVNISGENFLPLHDFFFEFIESDISDMEKHKIAIHFISKPFIFHATVDNYFLVSLQPEVSKKQTQAELLRLQPMLAIKPLTTSYYSFFNVFKKVISISSIKSSINKIFSPHTQPFFFASTSTLTNRKIITL
jgi:hypothetical protein